MIIAIASLGSSKPNCIRNFIKQKVNGMKPNFTLEKISKGSLEILNIAKKRPHNEIVFIVNCVERLPDIFIISK